MTRRDEQFRRNSNQVNDAEQRLFRPSMFLSSGYGPRGTIPALRERRWKSCATSSGNSNARAISCGAGW
jgi:hypothetical protein